MVQALLGHSCSEITREVYLHSIPADARAAVEKVEELLLSTTITAYLGSSRWRGFADANPSAQLSSRSLLKAVEQCENGAPTVSWRNVCRYG